MTLFGYPDESVLCHYLGTRMKNDILQKPANAEKQYADTDSTQK
jgi:hypothetical protein